MTLKQFIRKDRKEIDMYTDQEIAEAKKAIDAMSQYEMARMLRFAPVGHPYFSLENGDLSEYFKDQFEKKGGMTSEISKSLMRE